MSDKLHYLSLLNSHNPNYKNTFFAMEIATPIGTLVAVADKHYLYMLSFIDSFHLKPIEKILNLYSANLVVKANTVLLATQKQLKEYFNQQRHSFSLPLQLTGTTFQKLVWRELLKIPYGKTISYKQEAINIGNEKAFRAVANANGKNLISIIIPCHRVLNSNGKLGGYTGGIEKKIHLLDIEKES